MSHCPSLVFALVLSAAGAVACNRAMTRAEAREAMEELQLSSQSQALTSSTIELASDFSIGAGAQRAAEEVRDFVASQLPCAEVMLSEGQLSVEYGALAGNCSFRGQSYSGTHTIAVSRNEEAEVIVDHVWTDLENDQLRVSGTATVTWSLADRTRHVVHATQWTRLSDGRTGEGSGDRLQRALEGGLIEGFGVDGERTWRGEAGAWRLTMDGVKMRWVDPVPRAGRYELRSPEDRELGVRFERTSATQIRVTIEGPRRDFDFDVTTPYDAEWEPSTL